MKRAASLTLAAAALAALVAPELAHDGARGEAFTAARDAAFKQADVNGDGALTPDEFANFQQHLKQNLAAARFKRLDANGDGVVTADELAAFPGRGDHCRGK
jgi:Ca2+-binding EF-hand superfamily protein